MTARRSVLVAGAVAIALTGALFHRHRRGAVRPSTARPGHHAAQPPGGGLRATWRLWRAVWSLAGLTLGAWYDPLLAPFKAAGRGLWDAITAALHSIVDWVGREVDVIRGWLDGLVSWVDGLYDAAIEFARGVWNGLYQWARSTFDAVGRWTAAVVDNLARWAAGAIRQLGEWTREAVAGVLHAVDRGLVWVNEHLVQPLWHWITATVLPWFADRLGQLWDYVAEAVRFALWVEGHWLAFVVDPFGSIARWLGDVLPSAGRWFVGRWMAAVQGEADSVESMLAGFLDGL